MQNVVPSRSLAASCSAWGTVPAAEATLTHCRPVVSTLHHWRDLHLHPNTLQTHCTDELQMSPAFRRSKLQLRSPGWFWRNWKPDHISRFTPLTWLPFNDLLNAKELLFCSVYFSFSLHYSDVVQSSEISWRNFPHKFILNCTNFQMISNFVLATHTRQGLLQDTLFSSFLSFKDVVLW